MSSRIKRDKIGAARDKTGTARDKIVTTWDKRGTSRDKKRDSQGQNRDRGIIGQTQIIFLGLLTTAYCASAAHLLYLKPFVAC